MEIKSKNRVYSIVDEVESIRIEGELAIDGKGFATSNGTAMGTDGEIGRVSFYYQELAGGQVSQSISGCPTCAQKLSAVIAQEIAKAKEQVDGQGEETKEVADMDMLESADGGAVSPAEDTLLNNSPTNESMQGIDPIN